MISVAGFDDAGVVNGREISAHSLVDGTSLIDRFGSTARTQPTAGPDSQRSAQKLPPAYHRPPHIHQLLLRQFHDIEVPEGRQMGRLTAAGSVYAGR